MVIALIIMDGGFFTELEDERIVSITGRLGSGKTLLAMTIAERFLKRGYRLVTNVSTVWKDDYGKVTMDETGSVKAVILIDEGGLYIRTMDTVGALVAFARKIDSYVLVSGRREPHEEMMNLSVFPWFDFKRNLGLPIRTWKWVQRGSKKMYGGLIWEMGWTGYYGVYNTVDPGDNPRKLKETVEAWAGDLFRLYGHDEYELSDLERGGRDDVLIEAANSQARAAQEIRGAISALASEKGRGRFRKGRR